MTVRIAAVRGASLAAADRTDLLHGTQRRYDEIGFRCPSCTEAHRLYRQGGLNSREVLCPRKSTHARPGDCWPAKP